MIFLGNKIFVTKKSHIKVDYLGKNKYHNIWIDTEKKYCLETTTENQKINTENQYLYFYEKYVKDYY